MEKILDEEPMFVRVQFILFRWEHQSRFLEISTDNFIKSTDSSKHSEHHMMNLLLVTLSAPITSFWEITLIGEIKVLKQFFFCFLSR